MAERIYCNLPWRTMQLHFAGGYGPCCNLRFDSPLGTPTNRAELETLWNSADMRALRKRLVHGEIAHTRCGECHDRFFDTHHDIFGMSPELARYKRIASEAFDAHFAAATRSYRAGDLALPLPPVELYAYTSELCNLTCIMCTQNVDERLFPVEKLQAIVREIGWERIDRFGFVGGETLATKDAIALLEWLGKEDTGGACIYITTNGTLLERNMGRLEKLKNLFLSVSVDGFAESYEKIREGASWSKLLANIEVFQAARSHHPDWRLNIHSVVMRSSIDELIRLIDFARSLEATLFFHPIAPNQLEATAREDFFRACPDEASFAPFASKIEAARRYAEAMGADKAADSLAKLPLHWRAIVDATRQFNTRFRRVIDRVAGRPVVVYGATGHTEMLLKTGQLKALKIAALADRNMALWGQTQFGYRVIQPAKIRDYSDLVLISTKDHEREVFDQLTRDFGGTLQLFTLYRSE